MRLDIHFVKGHCHNICEDYGLVNPYDNFMIVADGCSTGVYSDLAARILVHACKNELIRHARLKTVPSYSSLRFDILSSAMAASKVLGLGDLLSTLLVAFKHPFENKIITFVYGDGYVAYQYRGGAHLIRKYDFNKNAPNYLWYRTNPDKFSINDADLVQTTYNNWEDIGKIGMDRNEEIVLEFGTDEIEYLSLMTDGVASFIPNKPKPESPFGRSISDSDAVRHLLSFKSMEGEFVKRRMKRFIKQVKSDGFIFDDDITCAVMGMEGENEGLS